ncbi:ABC transporter substrate-binding protein [Streptomyces sp. SID335]|uniref:ABC transporter substrate-binding protein n=1 Tax=Streptomyces venezuelae TaxID=54571 RepID=A0A5P2BN37_STRVZ|nr:ABC transporter substrate-binding protein [Streptomyces sp. SID335]MYZ14204.1 ABC transporter substrate-binding protein [Streptomyces sp. SID337]NDZ92399.1 ABC transporter substrate-binding protein [Streptomyces sp. SID10115]NDZ99034.1 ABC transporter substrate-binding protein [Streptomyces sp. SID10116]NEB50434.1 ABC transporter substrate-binding protein [Streptomyces sp. SID339]QES31896.1 ABC transporter substrate-binding protein [Streptomyces venezuelae]
MTALTATACGSTGTHTRADGTLSFTVAVVEPDLTTVPILAALDAVRAQGHEVDVVELAAPELAVEGLAKGHYAISAEATGPALSAIEQGAPIRIIADAVGNQWALYGKPSIASCDDLGGRPFGIFSEGAVATAIAKDWVGSACEGGVRPRYLTIGGSDVRAQALVSGEIDATPLEVSDAVSLESSGASGFTKVVDFAETLPDLHPQTVYANSGFLDEHRAVAQEFVSALVREHARITADPRRLVALARTHLPAQDAADVGRAARRYSDAKLFDAAALTPHNVQRTIDFFARAGVIGQGMTARDAADLGFVEEAS